VNTTAIIIATIAVIIIVIGGIARSRRNRAKTNSPSVQSRNDDFPPKPKWKPNVSVNIERTIKTFAYYMETKRSFAVFTNGTCVVVPNESLNAHADALKTLDAVYNYHPDFDPQVMIDGNFLIRYSQPAFSIVFSDEFATHRAYIERNHLDGLVRGEVILNAERHMNKFDDQGKIGLFGRARMFLDAQDPKIVRVWTPQ
jgi:hypothetical protein